jgi:CheY-like chemotaxis protein
MTVLVVDDEPQVNRLVGITLKRAGYLTESATDGVEAIEKLAETSYDAMVLDLMMPRVDGFGVVEYLATNQPEMLAKTVVLTASPREAARQRLGDVCHIVSKPFDLDTLIATVRLCVET